MLKREFEQTHRLGKSSPATPAGSALPAPAGPGRMHQDWSGVPARCAGPQCPSGPIASAARRRMTICFLSAREIADRLVEPVRPQLRAALC